jgi:hemolysin D
MFDRPVLLKPSPIWSRLVILGTIAVTTGVVAWGAIAQIEEAVPAIGQLEPNGAVKEIQSPQGGVVKTIHVSEGEQVKSGDLLVSLNATIPESQLISLRKIHQALELENQFYQEQIKTPGTEISNEATLLKPEIISLAKNRQNLAEENQLYRALLADKPKSLLNLAQKERQQASLTEFNTRLAAAALEVEQLEKQKQSNRTQRAGNLNILRLNPGLRQDLETQGLAQVAQLEKRLNENRAKKAGNNNLLLTNREIGQNLGAQGLAQVAQLEKQKSQNRVKRNAAAKILAVNQKILQDIAPLVEAGAISRVRYLSQEQQVITRQAEVDELDEEYAGLESQILATKANSRNELTKQSQEASKLRTEIAQIDEEYAALQAQIEEAQAGSRGQLGKQSQDNRKLETEIGQLDREYERLQVLSDQAQEKLKNTLAAYRQDLHQAIAVNDQKIAEIDSQFTKAVVDNQKQIAEINSQIGKSQVELQYQEIRAPVPGKVFEIKAKNQGFVTNASEPILKIVPNETLVAKVYITNQDIGFVREGMEVDVRIDSFPFSEYGDVKGKLIWIGADALEPDQVTPYARFPAKVSLNTPFLLVNGQQVSLQSGMSVSTNIKVRSRSVMSIFTDQFTKSVDSLKSVR